MKKRLLSRLLAGILLVTVCVGGRFSVSAETDGGLVSPGLSVLSAGTDVAIWARCGNEAAFSEDVFAKGLNLSAVKYITVAKLPTPAEGELLLASTALTVGQTVSAANLQYMTFVPADTGVTQGSFCFSVNGDATPITCNVYFLNRENGSPTVKQAPELALRASTFREMSAYGRLWGNDPDGDGVTFEIVSYPKNGAVFLTDSAGNYRYHPTGNYVGRDSFSYVARDKYGNYSASATVQLTVAVSGISETYADLEDSRASVAAMTLTEAGVMSGQQIGGQMYFYPEKTVNRGEFLLMAMRAAGITEIPEAKTTLFADDEKIPASMKGYVCAAYTLHYVDGTLSDGELCFCPDEPMTRAEAALLLTRVLKIPETSAVSVFADAESIPAWASSAMESLAAVGIFKTEDDRAGATLELTRADAALLLASSLEYLYLND